MFEDFKKKFRIIDEKVYENDILSFYIDIVDLKPILRYLKQTPDLFFERLDCIFAVDNGENIQVCYLLNSDKYNTKCIIACVISYEEEGIPSVCEIYKSANYDEREIYDLFGIKFINHTNLKRILLPESFVGFPLRKNFKMQDERLMWNYD